MAPNKSDEPALLDPGTEVSAKFGGAYCEAKIRSVDVDLRIRVRDLASGDIFNVKQRDIKTDLKDVRVQGKVTVTGQGGTELEAFVVQIMDTSSYTVVFNDGDVKVVKRTALQLKGAKHFDQSISLDNLPLTQPEKAAAADVSDEISATRRKTRNPSVASGGTEDSDVESVRRSGRNKKPVSEAPDISRPRRGRLGKIPEAAEPGPVIKEEPEELPVLVKPAKGRPGRKPGRKPKISSAVASREPSVILETEKASSSSKNDDLPVEAATGSRRKAIKTEDDGVEVPVLTKRKRGKSEDVDATAGLTVGRRKGSSPTEQEALVKKEVAGPSRESSSATLPDYPMRTVVCVPQAGRKRTRWVPGLVVHPDCRRKPKVDTTTEVCVRLFHTSAYQKVKKTSLKPFSESLYTAKEEDRLLKLEPDTVQQYLRDKTLPATWYPTIFTPFDDDDEKSTDGDPGRQSREDSEDESEATRFMIQLMSYRDQAGYVDDKTPVIKGQTVDMYKLYRAVLEAGGYNKCSAAEKWGEICEELELPDEGDALKSLYRQYITGGFESYFRTLATSITVTDIRLGRKRYQNTEKDVGPSTSTVVEPERHVQSPPPKRARPPEGSPGPASVPVKRGRGRPVIRGRPAATQITPTLLMELKEESPEVEEKALVKGGSGASTSAVAGGKRDISEEGSIKSSTTSEDEWAVIRRKVAPDVPPIADPSVLRPGAVVEVLYRNPKQLTQVIPYTARLMDNVGDVAYYVHYNNWNKRYDEWKPLSAILKVVDLQEVGSKQYMPTGIFQLKTRAKLKGKPWSAFRAQLDRALAAEEAATAPAVEESGKEKEGSEKLPMRSGSQETSKTARKRSPSKTETGLKEDEPVGEILVLPTAQPEPTAADTTVREPEGLSVAFSTKDTRKSPQPSTSSRLSEEKAMKEVAGEDGKTAAPAAVVEAKPAPVVKSQPAVLMKVDSVVKKGVKKEKTVVEGRKKTRSTDGEEEREEKVITPKRMLRMAKFLPDPASKKPAAPVPTVAVSGSVEEKKDKEGSGEGVSGDGKSKSVEKTASGKDDDSAPKEDRSSRSKTGSQKLRRPSIAGSSKSSHSEKEESTAKDTRKTSKAASRPEKSKLARLEESDAHSTEILVKSPVPAVIVTEVPEKTAVQKSTRKRHASESATAVEAVPVEISQEDQPAALALPVVDAISSAAAAASRASKEKDGEPVAVAVANAEKVPVQLATPIKSSRPDSKWPSSTGQSISQPRLTPSAKRSKPSRDSEKINVSFRAPTFAAEHKASLERLGLPLDGSESTKETVIKEDEFGSFEQLVIEGVDLTDPDLISGGNLTGTARIEAFERNLNDSLLVMQLLIHRLSTGYHVLKRCESLRQDQREERKGRDRKTGVKRTENGDSTSDDDKPSTAAGARGKTQRTK